MSWMSPNQGDCRAQINFAIVGFRYDTCFWDIYIDR